MISSIHSTMLEHYKLQRWWDGSTKFYHNHVLRSYRSCIHLLYSEGIVEDLTPVKVRLIIPADGHEVLNTWRTGWTASSAENSPIFIYQKLILKDFTVNSCEQKDGEKQYLHSMIQLINKHKTYIDYLLMMKVVVAIILLSLVSAQPNWQERIIFNGPEDYACIKGKEADFIDLIVNFDNADIKTILHVRGNTGCAAYTIEPQNEIRPNVLFGWSDGRGSKINFNQVPKYDYVFDKLMRIVQNATVRNPVTYGGQQYSCRILGDGQQSHFGQNPAPKIYLKCNSGTGLKRKLKNNLERQ